MADVGHADPKPELVTDSEECQTGKSSSKSDPSTHRVRLVVASGSRTEREPSYQIRMQVVVR
jgi:hypothetical protein